MKQILEPLMATSLVLLVFNTIFSSNAFTRECWSAVGATATADQRSRNFIVRGPAAASVVVGSPTSGGSTTPPLGPGVAVGDTFGFQDHMVSLSPSAPAGTYFLRYSVVPTSYFDNIPDNNQVTAIVFVQDNKRDRVVVQLKEIRYRTTSVPLDPKPEIKTVALIDTNNDFRFPDGVPSGLFVSLVSGLFTLTATREIPILDSPPFSGIQFVQYYLEVMLITNRDPPVFAPPTEHIRGPALALVEVCPRFDTGTCFFSAVKFWRH
jgi:hypothetical protein